MNTNKFLKTKSAYIVREFLEKTNLHKKDFAQMIGVTLSYVYNLIDENIPFSTRSITLERIATVMGIHPEEFIEYQIPENVKELSKNLILIKDLIKNNNLTTLDYIKMFDRKKRLTIVDILRGAIDIPIDFCFLKEMLCILNLTPVEIFEIWKDTFLEYLKQSGVDLGKNIGIINIGLDAILNNYILKSKEMFTDA